MPPGSMSRRACSPRRTCSEARRLEPASVSTRVPIRKIKREKRLAAGELGLRRPPVQASRNHEMNHEPDFFLDFGRKHLTPIAMRLPMRRSSRTVRPSTAVMGGSAVRRTKTLCRRTRSSVRPRMRGSSAVRYAVMSGSSGIDSRLRLECGGAQQIFIVAQRRIVLSISRVDPTMPRRRRVCPGRQCRPAPAWQHQPARCSRCAHRAPRQIRRARRREHRRAAFALDQKRSTWRIARLSVRAWLRSTR